MIVESFLDFVDDWLLIPLSTELSLLLRSLSRWLASVVVCLDHGKDFAISPNVSRRYSLFPRSPFPPPPPLHSRKISVNCAKLDRRRRWLVAGSCGSFGGDIEVICVAESRLPVPESIFITLWLIIFLIIYTIILVRVSIFVSSYEKVLWKVLWRMRKAIFGGEKKKKESWCNVCLSEFLRVRFNYEIFLRCNTRWFKRWKLIFSSGKFFFFFLWTERNEIWWNICCASLINRIVYEIVLMFQRLFRK